MITLYYFAGLKEAAGKGSESIEWTSGTAKDVRDYVQKQYPTLDLTAVQLAVNEEYVQEEEPVQPGDDVALIPPVSGG